MSQRTPSKSNLSEKKSSRRNFLRGTASATIAAAATPLLTASFDVSAAKSGTASALPDGQAQASDIRARYERAQYLMQGIYNKKIVSNTTLYPNWIEGSRSFWYVRELPEGNTQYRLFDAQSRENTVAFDHQALARSLGRMTGEAVEAGQLPISAVEIDLSPQTVRFSAFGASWIYDGARKKCKKTDEWPQGWIVSPDEKKVAFARDHNLWVRDIATGKEKALTHDGEKFNEYAAARMMVTYGRYGPSQSLEAIWSPDSKRLFTIQVDRRELEEGPPLMQYVPRDGSLRPKLLRSDRRVAFAHDEHIMEYQFLSIDVEKGDVQAAAYGGTPAHYPAYAGYFSGKRGWWSKDSRHAFFIDHERGSKAVNLVRFDTYTGRTKVMFSEISDAGITLIPISHIATLVQPLSETDELIWFSERSGWAHLYLYDLKSGKLKRQITSGDWLVRDVLHVDAERREIFIQTAGRVKGRNPYYRDIARVHIDTGKLKTIVSTNHDYVVMDGRNRASFFRGAALGVSGDGSYVVATRSRVDTVPESVLFDRNGRELMTVETADISGLPAGWQWPEPVMLKAADGKTDLMGVVYRPSDFDPSKSYPVIDCTYGYSAPIGSFSNNSTGLGHYMLPATYAELGFIAVIIHGRGEGLRHKTFNSYPSSDFKTLIRPKDDQVAGIKQLAKRYPYMDLARVGVAETGVSIPNALTGLLLYPDFYKVGVSNNSLAEGLMVPRATLKPGDSEYVSFEDLAGNLKGKLLIINGMLDWAIPVATTFRLVEALQKANKRFDMLILPNLIHTMSDYTTQRSWDYMVTHLLGVQPPYDFDLNTGKDAYVDMELTDLERTW